MRLEGMVLFITGAGSGIGRATSRVCAGYGAKIVATDVNGEAVAQTVNDIQAAGGEAIGLAMDVTDREQVKKAVADAVVKYGRIDGLFNNAGVGKPYPLLELTDEIFERVMKINLQGAFIVGTEVARVMIPNKKGRIVNSSSVAAFRGEHSMSTYCMAKASMAMLTQVMALEWTEYGITSVAISPGNIVTEMLTSSFAERAQASGRPVQEYFTEAESQIPMGRMGKPKEVGELVAFLFDERSAYMDGNNILLTGGLVM